MLSENESENPWCIISKPPRVKLREKLNNHRATKKCKNVPKTALPLWDTRVTLYRYSSPSGSNLNCARATLIYYVSSPKDVKTIKKAITWERLIWGSGKTTWWARTVTLRIRQKLVGHLATGRTFEYESPTNIICWSAEARRPAWNKRIHKDIWKQKLPNHMRCDGQT